MLRCTPYSKHTVLVDKDSVAYAVRASPPKHFDDVIAGVTQALEKLGEASQLGGPTIKQHRRGNFNSVTFGCSYGNGQEVS